MLSYIVCRKVASERVP